MIKLSSRSHEEQEIEELAAALMGLLAGRGVSPRDLSPEIPDGVLWSKWSNISLTEAILLAGPPIIPALERESGFRLKDLMRLRGEGLAILVSDRNMINIPAPMKRIVLFSLTWLMLNIAGKEKKLPVDRIRSLYLNLMKDYQKKWGEYSREAFSLMALGFEPFISSMKDISPLIKLVLHPVALAGSMKAYMPEMKLDSLYEISSKVLRLGEDFCVDLPSPKADRLELLRFARKIQEGYRELEASIKRAMTRLSLARAPNTDLKEILDQLSNELKDWSCRRKMSLLGAKVRRKILRFYALYPSAPELWLVHQEKRGFIRTGRGSAISAIPWPFREKGIAFLSLELSKVQN